MQICPKCQHERKATDDKSVPDYQCPACGVVYAKYLLQQNPAIQEALKATAIIDPETNQEPIRPKNQESVLINLKVAKWVAEFFLGSALLLVVMLAILIIGTIFSENSPLNWWIASIIIGAITTEAWFGYVIKLLIGIYINTKQKDN